MTDVRHRPVARVVPALTALALAASLAMTGEALAFKVGIAVGGNAPDAWQKAQGEVAQALAKQRGWDAVVLSNANDGPTAIKNADVFIQGKVDAVIQFNQQPSVNPVLAQKYAAAHIPVITYDIAQKGFYFVGVDNLAAGQQGGEALGQIAKAKWNCQPDLVLSAEFTAVGIVNTWRTGGMRDGLKKVCPDIPAEKFVSFEAGDQNTVEANARDQLAAHPDAKKILIVGISDNPEVAAIRAASQLGRADEVIAWGQDGSRITGSNVDPHLAGSVFYFLEGYPAYAFKILDAIAAGSPPPMKDTAEDPAERVPPCVVSAEQAKAVPEMDARVAKLVAAPKGTTEYDLFCPKQG
jgi:ABC-type sugar transport system substrate-binding protein